MKLKETKKVVIIKHRKYLRLSMDSSSFSYILSIHYGGQSPPLSNLFYE